MSVAETVKKLFPFGSTPSPQPVPAGTYPYVREHDGQQTRFHLRVDRDGGGILLANSTRAARLSAAGVLLAKKLLDGAEPAAIIRSVRRTFKGASRKRVEHDLSRVKQLINELAGPGSDFPILNLEDPALTGEYAIPEIPLGADVPIDTPDRIVPLLDRLWTAGIPHVTFVVSGDVDGSGLVRSVERAEDLGMIAGVRSRASLLCQQGLLEDLARAGVDHVNVLHLAADPSVHDAWSGNGDHQQAQRAIAELIRFEVCAVAEIALIEQTLENIEETLEELKTRGVHNVGFFAVAATDDMPAEQRQGALAAGELIQTAGLIEAAGMADDGELSSKPAAEQSEVRYVWYAPVRRDPGRALRSQIQGGPRASGDHAVRVEPTGEVYAARGPWQSAGNLLREDWDAIQSHPAYVRYRARVTSPTHCELCPGLAICAADCPRSPEGWSDAPPLSPGAS